MSGTVSGIVNIALGVVGIGMGLSGRVLLFTHSSDALIAGGAAIAAYGIFQVVRDRRR